MVGGGGTVKHTHAHIHTPQNYHINIRSATVCIHFGGWASKLLLWGWVLVASLAVAIEALDVCSCVIGGAAAASGLQLKADGESSKSNKVEPETIDTEPAAAIRLEGKDGAQHTRDAHGADEKVLPEERVRDNVLLTGKDGVDDDWLEDSRAVIADVKKKPGATRADPLAPVFWFLQRHRKVGR